MTRSVLVGLANHLQKESVFGSSFETFMGETNKDQNVMIFVSTLELAWILPKKKQHTKKFKEIQRVCYFEWPT